MANNTITQKNIVGIFKDIAINHKKLNGFFYGKLDEIDSNLKYPLLVIQPNTSITQLTDNQKHGVIQYSFILTVFDKLSKSQENYLDVINDTFIIANTFCSYIKQHRMFIDLHINLIDDISFEPVQNKTSDDVIGHEFIINIQVPNRYTPCNSLIEPITGWSTEFDYDINNYFYDLGLIRGENPINFQKVGNEGVISLNNIYGATQSIGSTTSLTQLEVDKYGRVTGFTTSQINTSLTITEIDNSPNLTTNKLIFPNGSISATSGGIEVNKFNGRRPITRSGYSGINLNTDDINQFLENFFFPAVPPSLSLTTTNTSRELGSSTLCILNWSITKQTRGIATINVAGNSVTVPSNINNDSDTAGSIGSGSVNTNTPINTNTTFSMNITDTANNSFSTSVTVQYFNKRYWGRLTNFSASDSEIIAGVGGGSELSTTRVQTRNNFDGTGNYLFFAFPSSFGTPTFTVNGLPNSAWTKIRSNSPFVNASGYTSNYDVWISNTKQNSPLNIVVN